MERQIQEIQHLATKYSKADLGRMVQMGLIDPQRAMMAGMMIDRIQKQNMQAPQSTVAQDVLGLPAAAPQQPQQPQQQMQQPQVPPQGTGIEQLPAGEVGEYAGGGIVAFGDGGDVPGYADRGYVKSDWQIPASEQKRRDVEWALPIRMKELEEARASGDPKTIAAAERQVRQIVGNAPIAAGGVYDLFSPAQAATTTQPAGIASTSADYFQDPLGAPSYTTEPNPLAQPITRGAPYDPSLRGLMFGYKEVPAAPAKPAAKSADKPAAPPVAVVPSAPGAPAEVRPEAAPTEPPLPPITRPTLRKSTFEENLQKATPKVESFDLTQDKSIAEIGRERRAAYAAEGYDPEVFNKIITGIQKKKGETATEKDAALGQAIMMTGFKLMGAREGQEFQTFSEGAQEGLKNYQGAIKDLKARQERYDERIETLRAADMQARRTGAESDIARRDSIATQVQADKRAIFQAKNSAAAAGVQAAASMTAADQNNAVQMYVADLQAQTARQYTAALKEQQIEASKAKILVDAAGDYISKNAANPKYLQDPGQLQADAIAYANSIGAQFGVTPKGASAAPPRQMSKDELKKLYNLQ
jgi:hypothetical protein